MAGVSDVRVLDNSSVYALLINLPKEETIELRHIVEKTRRFLYWRRASVAACAKRHQSSQWAKRITQALHIGLRYWHQDYCGAHTWTGRQQRSRPWCYSLV